MKRFLSVLLIALCLVAFVSPAHAFHGVRMTYAASGSSGITVADNNNVDYGTSNFFGGVLASLPDYTPSAEVILDNKHDGSNGRIFSVQTNGKLRLTINGTNYDSTVATGLTDGTQHFLSYSVTRETASVAGSILFGVDGVTLGTAVSITAGEPASISNASAQYIMGTSAIRSACIVSKFYSYNRALSAAEVLSLYQSGIATADQWGSQTAVRSDTAWTGATGTTPPTGWTDYSPSGTPTFTITDLSAVTNLTATTLQFEAAAGQDFCQIYINGLTTIGKNYRQEIAYRYNKAGAGQGHATTANGATVIFTNTGLAGDGVLSTVYGTGTSVQIAIRIYAGDTLQIAYFKAYETGATLDLEPSGIGAASWTDSSSNGLNASYPASGYSLFYNGQRNLLGVGQ